MEREQLIHLVQQAQAGDADAMDALFSAFYNDVYYFALKTVKDEDIACDITQETFVEILRTLGNLQEPAAFVRWMKQITYHQCTRYFSKKTDILVEEDEDGNTIFDTLADQSEDSLPAEVVEREDFRRTVMQMVDALTEEQRAAVLLYYFDEMTVGQIAEIQQVSAGTVKSRLNYARKALKKSVEDYEKKHNIKLCSFAPLALFLLYFGEAAMHPTKAAAMRAAVLAKNAGAAVAADAAAGAATAGGKAAAVPLWVKAVAGVVAAALAVGALVIAVSPDKERETPDRREEESVMQTQEETKETPSAPTESTTTFSGDMLVLYEDSLEYRDIFRGYVSDECEMFYTDNGVGFYSDEQGGCVEYSFADIDYDVRPISSNTFYYYDSESLLHIFAEGKWYACPGAAGVPFGITFNYDTGYDYLYEVQTLDEQRQICRYRYDADGLVLSDALRVSDNATDAQLAFDSNPVGIGFDYKLQSRIYAFASNNTLYTFSSLEYGFDQSHIATNTGIYVEKIFVNSAPFVFQGRENTAVYAIMDLNCTVKIDLPEGKTADRIVQVVTSGYDMIFLFEDGSVYYMQVEGFTTDGECLHSQLVYAEALTRLYQEGKIKQILSVTGYYRFCVAMDDNLTYQITADYWNSLI